MSVARIRTCAVWLALVACFGLLSACSDAATTSGPGTTTPDIGFVLDIIGSKDGIGLPDIGDGGQSGGSDLTAAGSDAEPGTDAVIINPGEFAAPCETNEDCNSGLCVPAAVGKVCTTVCESNCPAGWKCVAKTGTGDVTYLCLPANLNLCSPCSSNAGCNSEGELDNLCLNLGDDGSRFCGVACGGNKLPCPNGYSCETRVDPESGKGSDQCVPMNNQCTCSVQAVASGATTTCQTKNFYGTCSGQRSCTTAGLTDCSAQVPAQEACNAKDDDCNGQTDDLQGLVQCSKVNEFGSCPGTASACDPAGQPVCNAPAAKPEACNGVDDDCDGITDEQLCEDGNPCTEGLCNSDGSCQQKQLSGPACTDGNDCTETDKCVQGTCLGSVGLKCDDQNPCTLDGCDPVGGGCTNLSQDGPCPDDGLPCTLDLCQFGACAHPTQNEGGACPDDLNSCTQDYCELGNCIHPKVADTTACLSDGEACTDDLCVEGKCTHQANEFAKPCETDGNACTADLCIAGKCKHENLGPEKECVGDGLPCTKDVCIQGSCTGVPLSNGAACFKDNNPCTDDYCQNGKCQAVANSAPCQEDGNPCTQDICVQGSCKALTTSTNNVPCEDDANPCTVSKCLNGLCNQNFSAQTGTPCNDGDACTYGEGCDAASKLCKAVNTVQCNDGNPCTYDSCNQANGCVYEPISNNVCSDGDSCTTGDKCEFGECIGQGVKTCDDGNVCTDDGCDGGCSKTPNSNVCKLDDNPCTQEVCEAGQCKATAAFNGLQCGAASGNPCMEGQCSNGTCQGTKLDGKACTDGNGCTQGDTCTGGLCKGTSGKSCDDGNPCTTDSCDEFGECIYSPGSGAPCNAPSGECPLGQCIAGTCQSKAGLICEAEYESGCNTVNVQGTCTSSGKCVVASVPPDNSCPGCQGICITCFLFLEKLCIPL
jgi:hypothetical protein